jgi:2-polyprenyl-3-methyl-5-hydroxy-6-metoxy-1,4-benzoquinol methylase
MNETARAWDKVRQTNVAEGFTLGPINAESMLHDPKHLGFVLARYKFAGKMLRRCTNILDVGCGEGLGVMMYLAETGARITAVDFDEDQIAYCRTHVAPHGRDRVVFESRDVIASPIEPASYDGMSCLDVIEHLHSQDETPFFEHCAAALQPGGVAVWGTPSLHSSAYASARSQLGHINLFDPDRLVAALERHYRRVFLFSMNDEMVHTGFSKMAHYLVALCVK